MGGGQAVNHPHPQPLSNCRMAKPSSGDQYSLQELALAGRTLFSKCPWLVMFPAGKYLATTKEEPSDATALPTPSFLVFFHTIAVKCPINEKKSEIINHYLQSIPLIFYQIAPNDCDNLLATFECESVIWSHAHWSYGKPSGGIRADMIWRVRFKRDKQDCEVPRVSPWLATETSGHRLQHKHNNNLPHAWACVTFCENDCQQEDRDASV